MSSTTTVPATDQTPSEEVNRTINLLRNRSAIAIAVGFALLLAASLVVVFLNLGMSEIQWNRALYIIGGVEAIAFAGVGFLFGSEVHRQRAEKAEQHMADAASARRSAENKAHQSEAALQDFIMRGQALRDLSQLKYDLMRTTRSSASSQAADSISELATFAARMFPKS